MAVACAICALCFDSPLTPVSEKPRLPGRDLECCGRSICSVCLAQNKRYETYCPYCQITTQPSSLPQGLKDPPPYSSMNTVLPVDRPLLADDLPPAYSEHLPVQPHLGKREEEQPAEDVLHFVRTDDSMHRLALAYGVPINALRKTNNVYSDHLLQARKTILIPGLYYRGGVSLSPQPEDEEEEIKKNKLRRWMMACKVADYDIALLYLKQTEFHLEAAIEAYREDERWEQDHPLKTDQNYKQGKRAKTAGMRRFVGESARTHGSTR